MFDIVFRVLVRASGSIKNVSHYFTLEHLVLRLILCRNDPTLVMLNLAHELFTIHYFWHQFIDFVDQVLLLNRGGDFAGAFEEQVSGTFNLSNDRLLLLLSLTLAIVNG